MRVLRVAGAVGAAVALALLLDAPTTVRAEDVAHVAATLSPAEQRAMLHDIDAVGRRGFLYAVDRAPAAGARPGPTLYLYGTIHLGRVGSEPFNGAVLAALRGARRIALEADPSDGEAARALAMRYGRYADGDALARHVSPALLARVQAYGERNGLPPDRIARLRPWLLANMVALSSLSDAGLDPAMGSEYYLTGYARSARLPIVEIEGVESQLRMLAALPDAMQAAQLDEALADVDSDAARTQTAALFDLWLHGDQAAGDAMIDTMRRDAGDRLFERYVVETLIDRRNGTMADRAERLLALTGDTFFAVGSLHLFGDAGLIRAFERRGYRVVDLQRSLPASSPR